MMTVADTLKVRKQRKRNQQGQKKLMTWHGEMKFI